ncbi:hypothetical protein KCP75_05765 [Salmonella enterica subsp. enterica]|nr:hypothetical protein KCP75_05765 [Salmonella enterica subsp. enterica]
MVAVQTPRFGSRVKIQQYDWRNIIRAMSVQFDGNPVCGATVDYPVRRCLSPLLAVTHRHSKTCATIR